MECPVCGRVSAGGVHLDCAERRRIELEDEKLGRDQSEGAGLAEADLAPELRALMEHMSRERGA